MADHIEEVFRKWADVLPPATSDYPALMTQSSFRAAVGELLKREREQLRELCDAVIEGHSTTALQCARELRIELADQRTARTESGE